MISYEYDQNGNLTSIAPPGRSAHNFSFDSNDMIENYLPPLLSGNQSTQTRMSYNLDKQLTKIERPDGREINYIYNSLDERIQSIATSEGSYGFSYISDYRVSQLTSPYGLSLNFSWDSHLNVGETYSGAVSGSVSLKYNQDFLLKEVLLNGATAFSYSYDNDNLLTSAGEEVLVRNSTTGFVERSQIGTSIEDWTYNNFGELETMSSSALDYTLERDSLGRIIKKTEAPLSGQSNVFEYVYDLAGRLSEVYLNGSLQERYGYDSNSNRISLNGSQLGFYDDQDRMTLYGSNTYTYNLNGDLELKTNAQNSETTQYVYDSFGNLIQVGLSNGDQITYVIDGTHRRVAKRVNGVKTAGFLYLDQLNPVAELNPDDSIKSIFIYSVKSNVPSYMIRAGIKYRLITDHLGSVRYVINTTTNMVAQEMEYDTWGRVTKDTNPGFQPFGFAGGLYDRDTGLVRFGARDYDAETGRWTSKDPILFAGGDTNLYGYVLNDPVNFVDPEGEAALIGGIIIVGGGLVGIHYGSKFINYISNPRNFIPKDNRNRRTRPAPEYPQPRKHPITGRKKYPTC